jgi:hypothetical protein
MSTPTAFLQALHAVVIDPGRYRRCRRGGRETEVERHQRAFVRFRRDDERKVPTPLWGALSMCTSRASSLSVSDTLAVLSPIEAEVHAVRH